MNSTSRAVRPLPMLPVALVASLSLTGCVMGPEYVRPRGPDQPSWRNGESTEASIADLAWWEIFEDQVLLDLITEALKNNRDLRAALARIEQAAAGITIVQADLYPRVDVGAFASGEDTTDGPAAPTTVGVVAPVTWQVDLWGRIQRATEAAEQELLATEEAYRGITITLVANVATTYFLLRDIDNRLAISERTAETRRASLDVMLAREQGGAISRVDLRQSEILLADAVALTQTFRRLRTQTENALSVLIGRPPVRIARGAGITEQNLPPETPAGLPSRLLERRPDVLVAERRLAAQTARIGVAEALQFPQLTLSADLGVRATDDVTAGFASLAANLFGPLVNWGQVESQIEFEKARTRELLNAYEQAVLLAFLEVEDQMIAAETFDLEYAQRSAQVEAARDAVEMSDIRYAGGLTSYLEFLETQRSLYSAELAASETLRLKLSAIVGLYAALGGGWQLDEEADSSHDELP